MYLIKKILIILTSIIGIMVIFIILLIPKNTIGNIKEIDVCFINKNVNILSSLKQEEVDIIKKIFHNKFAYYDSLTCGFSEFVSIRINKTETLCIARDTCPFVYWKEKNKYFKLSEKEKNQLYGILEDYGFFFPCI